MRKPISSFVESDKLSPGAKGVLLVIGAYFVTLCAAVFIITVTILMLLEETHCSVMSRAVVILWITIFTVFLASVIVVRSVVRRIIPSTAGRVALVVAHGVALLASYVVIAFGLLIAFDC